MDVDEALEQTTGGFWFEFEQGLTVKDSHDPAMSGAVGLFKPCTTEFSHFVPDLRGVCKFYLKGACQKGSSCPYKHVRSTRGERSVVCKHWLRALCKKGDNCEFLHQFDLSKMPECFFFSKFGKTQSSLILITSGECSNPECMYLHINPEDKMKECPWYARGFCKHGMRL